MSEMPMGVKMVAGHQAGQFEERLTTVINIIEEADGEVFPIQYQYNAVERQHTAVVQYTAPKRITFPEQLSHVQTVEHGLNPKIFNEDGSRKDGAPGVKAEVVNSTKPQGGSLLPPADA